MKPRKLIKNETIDKFVYIFKIDIKNTCYKHYL